MKMLKLSLLIALLLPALAFAGKVYKWVDAEGNVQFGDQPQRDSAAEEVTIQKHTPDKTYLDRMEAVKKEQEKTDKQQQDQQQDTAELEAMKKRQQEVCEQAKRNLEVLQNSPRVSMKDEQGNTVYLDGDQREAELKKNQDIIKESCK
ncbi:MAG: DUF4124 domain-containing protein [Pseudomonadota bacterium]